MRSGFVGKRQARSNEPPKRTEPPKGPDLTQLLSASQKAPDKTFLLSWQPPGDRSVFVLTVSTTGASRDKSKGWSASAIDNSALSEADWRLVHEYDGQRAELFVMRTSDAYLILTLIDEALVGQREVGELRDTFPTEQTETDSTVANRRAVPPPVPGTPPVQEGNLRSAGVRNLMQGYNASNITGRLMCESGHMQVEVFFSKGEPVHAKSCHAIYQDRDTTGDSVIIELLTWRDGNYKFQEGWPAALRSINHSLQMFLDGQVEVNKEPPPVAAQPAADSPAPASVGSHSTMASHVPLQPVREFTDDFSDVDEVIASLYDLLVEPCGIIKYGMFLMLSQSEFVRFSTTRIPFCLASIAIELPNATLTEDVLRQVGECFHPVCQPLDVLAIASPSRLFGLFPQCDITTAASTMKHFCNNILSTPLDSGVHGSSMKIGIGLCEVPRDGEDFDHVIMTSVNLRRTSTPERRIVTTVPVR